MLRSDTHIVLVLSPGRIAQGGAGGAGEGGGWRLQCDADCSEEQRRPGAGVGRGSSGTADTGQLICSYCDFTPIVLQQRRKGVQSDPVNPQYWADMKE